MSQEVINILNTYNNTCQVESKLITTFMLTQAIIINNVKAHMLINVKLVNIFVGF